jgi:RNA polymerase subunit RPABC4/transcription elongation factor Spt4
MSIEDLTVEAPPTRHCRVCSVEINAATARCPYCGARQFKRQPILGWRGLLICLVAVAIAVLVTRAVVNAANDQLRYVPYRSSDLAALVPVGYSDLLASGPHGTAVASFQSSSDSVDTETVRATMPAVGTPHSRTVALSTKLSHEVGVAQGYLGPVVFPGGQTAYALEYTFDNGSYAVFAFDACNHKIAVTLTLANSRESVLGDLSKVVPQSANPICDGPAFSNRSRADTAIPLSLPR